MNSTKTRSHLQFVIDEIPQNQLNAFLNIIEDFRIKTNCRFRFKQGQSVKYPLHIVPTRQPNYEGEELILDYEGM